VALLFGGRSAEHDVSLMSAANVYRALDPERYEVVPIAVARTGDWMLCPLPGGHFPTRVPAHGPLVTLLPGGGGRLVMASPDGSAVESPAPVDVIFPVLHGPFGEDGSVQGFAELAGVPFVGASVFASAAAMDKDAAKRLLRDAGLPIPRFCVVTPADTPSFAELTAELGRPLFVKPLTTSLPGEIVPTNRDQHGAELKVPADLPEALVKRVQDLSVRAFRALGCEAMARVDFFLRPDMSVVVNEVNTIPGFTNISMYPLAFEASGVSCAELVDRLIQHALARAGRAPT
jgi:D-alanine-D-alanine ligase